MILLIIYFFKKSILVGKAKERGIDLFTKINWKKEHKEKKVQKHSF